ncbi:MAG: GntR family transcriptional regulator [Halomonas sp.]|uniref:GntR family transcriptional regulator n=1 Tax=Billgrantia antri TaxID=2846777 RepID=A0ABS6ZJN7_9GAMM|nr:GntR family transcriptional regulator [Halomonas antri]MBW6389948.1 GntR family transcriptional regulator [Halomonas antri]MDX5377947.1 GntR family transcriptional regulator [Halomonas sp.]MDX5503301.1 GntR family transcriptional regulator [Halomonas sp.]
MNQRQSLAEAGDSSKAKPRRLGKNGDGAERHEAIYRTISDAIIEHRLRPGARLREDALAEVFGISRTGIRKILQRLALEQLVTLTPRRGASVTRPTADEAKDVFDARQMVECGLMPEVARRITAENVRELRDMARREREALKSGEQSRAIKLSAAFHERIAQLSGNATLASFVGQLCSRSSLILAVYGSSGHLGCESHDHDDLIGYLDAGNGERAAAFMSRHLKAIEASLSIVEEEEDTPDLQRIFGA